MTGKVKNKGYWLGTVESYLNLESGSRKRVAPASLKELKDLGGVNGKSVMPGMFSGSGTFEEDENETGIDVSHMVSISGGVGVIRIAGTLVNEYSPANRWWGDVSYDEVAAAAELLQRDPEVKSVILDIDTPGGDANGIERGSAALSRLAAEKPVYTFTSAQMCSAGYWLGCTAKEIWASSLSIVGSIGVVAIHRSYEKMMENEGVKVTVMRQGQYKMLLNPFEDLTPEAEAMMQEQMAIIYSMFIGHVSDRRKIPPATLMAGPAQGQTFLGLQAVKEGLVDQVGDFTKLVNQLRSKYASQVAGVPGAFKSCDRGLDMKTFNRGGKLYALNAQGQAAVAAGLSEDEAAKNDEFLSLVSESEPTQEEKDAAAAAEQAAADEAAAAAAAAASQTAATATNQAGDVSVVLQLSEKLATQSATVATLTAEVASLKAQVEAKDASLLSLRRVAVEAINNKEVAMNMTLSKVEDFDNDATILAKHTRLVSDFNGRYKPGARAEHSTGAQKPAGTAASASSSAVDTSAQNLTSFGGKK